MQPAPAPPVPTLPHPTHLPAAQHTKELIKQTFGRIPPSLNQPSPAAAAVNAELLAGAGAATAEDAAPTGSNGSSNGSSAGAVPAMEAVVGTAGAADAAAASGAGPTPNGAILQSLPRPRGMVRPPVEHQWGCTSQPVRGGLQHAPVSVFRHRLLQVGRGSSDDRAVNNWWSEAGTSGLPSMQTPGIVRL